MLAALLATLAMVTFGLRVEGASASPPCVAAADLVPLLPPNAAAASCFEGFDGNQVSNHPALAVPHIDWQNLVGQSGLITMRDDTGDSTFSGGDKENDPGGWAFNPAGSAQGKVDVLAAAMQTDRVGGDTFVYGAFERLTATGDVFLSFEFNQIPTLFDHDNNAATAPIPERSTGDALVTFTGNQGNIDVYMCRWWGDGLGETSDPSYGWYELPGFGQPDPNGPGLTDKATGSDGCTLLDPAGSPAAAGEMNNGAIDNYIPRFGSPAPLPANGAGAPNTIADEEFGEMVINLDAAIQRGGAANPCFAFGAVWVHTRGSHSFTSGMEDLTTTTPIPGTGSCAIGIDKTVSVNQDPNTVPADGTFADTAFAETGDTLHYRFAVTNDGTEPITNVTVTDPVPLCSAAPVRTAGDDGDNVLEVGETWIYRCTRTYGAGDANTLVNTGTAKGQVGAGLCPAPPNSNTLKCVEDTDTATVTRVTKLTITKDTVPNALQDFAFETGGTGLSNFILDDDAGEAGADNTRLNTTTFTNPGAGDKYVREAPAVPGYSIGSITCTGDTAGVVIGRGGTTAGTFVNGGADGFDAGDDTVKVPLDVADQVSCTFVNNKDAKLTVVKETSEASATPFTINHTGTGMPGGPFSLVDDDGGPGDPDDEVVFQSGEFGVKTLSEVVPAGWSLGSATCTGAADTDAGDDISVDVQPAADVVCTFVNNKDAKLTVVKETSDASSQAFTINHTGTGMPGGPFSLVDDDGGPGDPDDEVVFQSGEFGVKTLSEVVPAGWSLGSATCTGAADTDAGDDISVDVQAGDDVVCTFLNNKDTTVKIVKDADPNDAQDFGFTTTGTGLSDFSLDDDTDNTLSNEKTFTISGRNFGTKTVTEGSTSGWALTDIACTGDSNAVEDEANRQATLDVDPGETIVCTFFNRKDASVTVTKQHEPSTDDGRFDLKVDQTVVRANAADGESGTRNGLAPGTYTVSEVVGSASPAGRALSDYGTGIECSGESPTAGSSTSVTVSAGENATCTITNTRKGSISVTKDLGPDTDDGRFDLRVDSDVVANEAGDGGTGTKSGLAPGTYTVSEVMGSTAPAGRTLANYQTEITCTGEAGEVAGSSTSVALAAGENVACTITNNRIRVPDAPVIDTTPRCLRRPVIAFVRGKRIKQVVFYLDGKQIDVVRKRDAKKRFSTLIQQRLLADGPHKLRARVTFFYTKKVWWLRATLKRCLSRAIPTEILTTPGVTARCPATEFIAYVRGETISSVTYTLNGKRLRTRRVANWKKRYFVKIDPTQLGEGPNVLMARVRFIAGRKKAAITLTKELPSCRSALR